MPIERKRTTTLDPPTSLRLQMGYMRSVAELEQALAEACALAGDVIRGEAPDKVRLEEMRERWAKVIVRSRSSCRQPRKPKTIVDRVVEAVQARRAS